MINSKISKDFNSKFDDLIQEATEIVVTGHESPDEDSIGSVLSTYEILVTRYPKKKIRIIYSSDPEPRFRIFKNYDKIEFVSDIAYELKNTDLLIFLDGSQYSRFSKYPEKLQKVPTTICIDHHSSPIDEFTLTLVLPAYPSCTEIIYLVLCQDYPVSKELAEIFLMGILGDTGNFTYIKPHQTETLATTKKLLEISEIEIQEFQSRYRTISQKTFLVIQELIKNTRYSCGGDWPDFQYSYIDRDFTEGGKYTDSEISEGNHIYMSNYLRMITGYSWGFVITPKGNGDCGISGRSLPNSVSVRDLMEKMKIGGGHDRASGGKFKDKSDSKKCIEEVLNWISSNKPVIT